MFRSATINHHSIIVPNSAVHALLSTLQENQICQVKTSEANLSSFPVEEQENKIMQLLSRLEFVQQGLLRYQKEQKASIFEVFAKKKKPPKRKPLPTEQIIEKLEECLEIVEGNVTDNLTNIRKIEERINNNTYFIENLSALPSIQTSNLKDSEHLAFFIGYSTNHLENLENALIFSEKQEAKSLIIAVCLQKHKVEVESALHEQGFDTLHIPYEQQTPEQIIASLTQESENLAKSKKTHLEDLNRLYVSYHSALGYFHEELALVSEKITALSELKSTETFSTLECWVPLKNQKAFNEIIKPIPHFQTTKERADAPTLLQNLPHVKPFEGITELFSLPKYKEFDPTPLLAFTFSFFFAFMLTDAVYGMILLIFGILLMRGKGSYHEPTKNTATILIIFGVLTTILGMIFGSYFGDILQRIGVEVPLLLDSLTQVMIVLIIAICIGTLHLLVGMFIGFFENLRKKQIQEALHKQGVWILFVASLILFVLNLPLYGGITLGVSVILQLVLTFMEAGAISSVLSLFSFPGFLGDLFSYARLTALALGTTGIALAVNFMTLMVWDMIPFVGPIFAILIFIVGHIFNMAMNGLGAFVHSIRLHFLEFFSRFYEGAGKKYIAFGTNK